MITELAPKRFFWITFTAVLAACGTLPAQPTPAAMPDVLPIIGTPTLLPTEIPSPTPLPPFPLDGYVMVFTRDGDLYFRDGENPPVKLTHVGKNAPSAILSDDNQKIVFFREDSGYSNIYSINRDGSQEQVLVMARSLPKSLNRDNAQAFVPGTHQLLFNTYECQSQEEKPLCAIGLSLVDTDTGEIKELVARGEAGQYNFDGNFKVSPDGKMISVAMVGLIDIYDMDGFGA